MQDNTLDTLMDQFLRRAESKTAFRRILCIWLRSLGLTSARIGHAIGWKPGTVRSVQSVYTRKGEAAFARLERGGRRRAYLSLTEETEVLRPFIRYAMRTHHPLNIGGLKHAYEQRIGRSVPVSTIYRLIQRHAASRLLARPVAARA